MIRTSQTGHTRLMGKPCCYLTYSAVGVCAFCLILLLSCVVNVVSAQHLSLKNSSLEGVPGVKVAPVNWAVAANTPDILPGVNGCFKLPFAGKTFVGLQAGPVYREGIEQELPGPMVANRTYSVSMDLAFSRIYGHEHCYGNLAIFAGSAPGDTSELLWTSGSFTDTAWHRWTATFTPRKTHHYISFYAYPEQKCAISSAGVVVFIDNLSTIKQILRTEMTASSSCKNSPTGSASIKVTGGAAPYSYQWTPGNYRTQQINNVPAGMYTVTVTSADGVTATGSIQVSASDLTATTSVKLSDCAGDNTNEIKLDIQGGIPPYDVSMNGEKTMERDFTHLVPGNYVFVLKDEQVCKDTFNVFIKEPAPLVIKQVDVQPCSCVEVNDGSIRWVPEGGTRPYKYRIDGDMWQVDSLHRNLKAGFYRYRVEDANGCEQEGDATVTSPWQNCLVLMPSAFSPNGDGNNDVFRPKIYDAVTDYQLKVYNRWGSLIFQSGDPKIGWDGYCNGIPQHVQAFVYVCTFKTSKNEPKEYRGTVMLLK